MRVGETVGSRWVPLRTHKSRYGATPMDWASDTPVTGWAGGATVHGAMSGSGAPRGGRGAKLSGGFLRGRPGLAAVLAEPADLGVDELVDLAVEDRHGVTGLHSGPHVLD